MLSLVGIALIGFFYIQLNLFQKKVQAHLFETGIILPVKPVLLVIHFGFGVGIITTLVGVWLCI